MPTFVPTPCIEALRTITSRKPHCSPKSLITSNNAQLLGIVPSGAKLLIVRRRLPPEQKVRGSNPLGRTTYRLLGHQNYLAVAVFFPRIISSKSLIICAWWVGSVCM